MTLYVQPHQSQYQAGASAITRRAGCTWSSGANGVGAVTGGTKRPDPDEVHRHLATSEQTSPETPGWSLADLRRALGRMGVRFDVRSGDGWDAAVAALESDHYVCLQGDSDVFGNTTCSGAFDGDHCIGIHPRHKVEDGERWWWIDDPICRTARWERESVLRRYAMKLNASILFGVFAALVPEVVSPPPPPPPVTLRFGARKLTRPLTKRIHLPRGRRANVRTAPRLSAHIARRIRRGRPFTAWQVVHNDRGRWYGNRRGNRWVHASSF